MTNGHPGGAAKGPELIICPAHGRAREGPAAPARPGARLLREGADAAGEHPGRASPADLVRPLPVAPYLRGKSPVGERFTCRDEIIVTEPQLALLEALRDAPERAFATQRAWVETSLGILPGGWTGRHRVVRRMPEEWVARVRCGSRHLCVLQDRGLDVVEGRLPVWLFGAGPYAGLAHPRPGEGHGGTAASNGPGAEEAAWWRFARLARQAELARRRVVVPDPGAPGWPRARPRPGGGS